MHENDIATLGLLAAEESEQPTHGIRRGVDEFLDSDPDPASLQAVAVVAHEPGELVTLVPAVLGFVAVRVAGIPLDAEPPIRSVERAVPTQELRAAHGLDCRAVRMRAHHPGASQRA